MSAVLYEVDERIATLTLNRPESLNAVNPAMIDALLAASVQAAGDPQVRAVIVRGAGEHFMAGGDVKWFRQQLPAADRRERFAALLAGVQAAVLNFRRMDKPVIA